jgi:hypothetical protein
VFATVRAVVAVLAAVAGLTAATASAGQAATPTAPATPAAVSIQVQPFVAITNTVYNYSDVNLGVIQKFNQPHAHGHYDVLLPAQERHGNSLFVDNSADYRGWTTTGGFYIGPGYCADLFRHDFGLSGPWEFQMRIGPGEHPIGSNTSYRVYAFRPFSGSCA